MSDMLTHWASFEDCKRLAQLDENIAPDFRTAVDKGQHFARLGTLSYGGNTWMEPLLRGARDNWNASPRADKYDRNLAFVLGGLIHQACDRVMKPFLSAAAGSDWSEMHAAMRGGKGERSSEVIATQELSAYVDAEVFRQVYAGGEDAPFSRFFMSELSRDGRDFEEFVRATYQRSLLASHTLRPDQANLDAWLDNLFEKIQPLYLDVDLWVKVFRHPDPKKIEALALHETFYRLDDPSIRAARLIREGKPVDEDLRRAVFDAGTSTCAYGEVLQLGLSYMRSASAFWRRETEVLAAPNYIKGAVPNAAAMPATAQTGAVA